MRKKSISDEEMKCVRLEGINISEVNSISANSIYEMVLSTKGSKASANAAAGYYLKWVVDSLLNGLKDVPDLETIKAECECDDIIARMIKMALMTAHSQVKSTRQSRIGGAKTKGNKTNHAKVLCPELENADLDEEVVGLPFIP